MTNAELTKRSERSIDIATANEAQIKLVRDTFCADHTDPEFANFIHICVKYGLDPYAGHICSVKYKNKKTGEFYPAQTIVERDGYASVAHKDPSFDGMVTDEFYDEDNNVLGATCNVYRKGMAHPSATVKVFIKEYKDPYNKSWQNMPVTMIRKVAESQALRKSFGLTGTYSSEEYNPVKFNQPKMIQGEASEVETERNPRTVVVLENDDTYDAHENKPEPDKNIVMAPATKSQRSMIEAIISKRAINRDALKKKFELDSMKNLTKGKASEIIEYLNENQDVTFTDDPLPGKAEIPNDDAPKTNKAETSVIGGLMSQAGMSPEEFKEKFNCTPDSIPKFKFDAISKYLSARADENDNK